MENNGAKAAVLSASKACELISDGDMIAIGGCAVHRVPMSIIYEIITAEKRDLRLIKVIGGMDADILCAAQAVKSIDAGYIGYETAFGFAKNYRKAVEDGVVTANEHSCYTVIQGLRAASCGAPFMPVSGLKNSDLIDRCEYFSVIKSPFGSDQVTVVRAIEPDVCVIQASRCDIYGNCEIFGAVYEDVLMSRASKKVIVAVEEIVEGGVIEPEKVHIPGFLVTAVAHCPKGAHPGAHYGYYDIDGEGLRRIMSVKNRDEVLSYIKSGGF